MKVLQVTPAFYPAHGYGGPIQSMFHLCCYLGRVGCEVRVLTTDANGIDGVLNLEKQHEIEIETNVRVRYCKRVFRHSVSTSLLSRLPSYVGWADIVHLRGVYSFPTIFTLLICKVIGKPVLWTPHGAFQQWKGVQRRHAKAIWELVCKFVAPVKMIIHAASEKEAQTAIDHFPRTDVVIIPHGIEIPSTVTHKPCSGSFRVLYMGRLHPVKGIEQLLDACRIVNDRSKESLTLTIAGTGTHDYTRTIENRIANLGLRHHIEMAGEVIGKAKQHLFERTDIVVVPSFTESFSLVVAESLAHAVPVVASTGTPWSRLMDMDCGLWVPNNPEILARAIETMKRLPLREMGEKGRMWMQKEFHWEYRTQQMLNCYHRMIRKHGVSTSAASHIEH